MNIALVISSLASGGAERVMSQLADYWAARGDVTTLITLASYHEDAYPLDARVRRVCLGMVNDSNGFSVALVSNWHRIIALRHAVIATGATAVLSFEDRTNVLVLLATMCLPLRRVICERTDPRVHRIGTIWGYLRRLTYPFANMLVVQTAALVPWARRVMLNRRRVNVIANPVRPMARFVNEPSEDSCSIVAVGRLMPEKGFDVLLAAFAKVAHEIGSCSLTIVGEGPSRATLVELAQTLHITDCVSLPGWVREPGEVLQKARLFVMPSRYEGFPNALIEAMACGLPVISTRWAGAERIITDGVDGLLVPILSVEDMATAISRLMHDAQLRCRLGRNALAVAERYKISATVESWDEVLTPAHRPLLQSASHQRP